MKKPGIVSSLTVSGYPVVDVFSDGQVQNAETEGREDDWHIGGRPRRVGQNIIQGATDELPVANLLLGKVR